MRTFSPGVHVGTALRAAQPPPRLSRLRNLRHSVPDGFQALRVTAHAGISAVTAVLASSTTVAPALLRNAASVQASLSPTAAAIAGTAGGLGVLTGAGFVLSMGALLHGHLTAGRAQNVSLPVKYAPYVALGVAVSPIFLAPWTWPAVLGVAALGITVSAALTDLSKSTGNIKQLKTRVAVACAAGIVAGLLCASVGQGTLAAIALRESLERVGVIASSSVLAFAGYNMLFARKESGELQKLMPEKKTVEQFRLEMPGEGRPTVFEAPAKVIALATQMRSPGQHGWVNLTLHGAPGVGKTAIALAIGQALHAEVVAPTITQMRSAIDDVFPVHYLNAVSTLVESFELAQNSGRPVVIIWDEAESLWNSDVQPSALHTEYKIVLLATLERLRSIAQRQGVSVLMVNTTNYPERVVCSLDPDGMKPNAMNPNEIRVKVNLPSQESLKRQLTTGLHELGFPGLLSPRVLDTLSAQLHQHGCSARHVQSCVEHLCAMQAAGVKRPAALHAQEAVDGICSGQIYDPPQNHRVSIENASFISEVIAYMQQHGWRGVVDACRHDMIAISGLKFKDPMALHQADLAMQRFLRAHARMMIWCSQSNSDSPA